MLPPHFKLKRLVQFYLLGFVEKGVTVSITEKYSNLYICQQVLQRKKTLKREKKDVNEASDALVLQCNDK